MRHYSISFKYTFIYLFYFPACVPHYVCNGSQKSSQSRSCIWLENLVNLRLWTGMREHQNIYDGGTCLWKICPLNYWRISAIKFWICTPRPRTPLRVIHHHQNCQVFSPPCRLSITYSPKPHPLTRITRQP